MLRLLPGIVDLVLTVVAIVDIALIDPSRVRGLPKWAWAAVSILLFVVGPLLWFIVGRERLEPREASAGGAPRQAPRAPDDDPEFLGRLSREREQEQRIRELERRLQQRDEPDDPTPDDPKPAG